MGKLKQIQRFYKFNLYFKAERWTDSTKSWYLCNLFSTKTIWPLSFVHLDCISHKWDYLQCVIIKLFFVSCFSIGKVPRSPGKWNWNLLSFLAIHFHFWTMWTINYWIALNYLHTANTVLCILLRTVSFPRFWRNHA